MKIKAGILFVSLVILGQALYMQLTNMFDLFLLIRCFIQTITLFMLGDLIGYMVLRIPLFNYSNLITYFKREIFGQAGFMFVFGTIWASVIAFIDIWGYGLNIIGPIAKGGLIPATYYMIMHRHYFSYSDRVLRMLKRKL